MDSKKQDRLKTNYLETTYSVFIETAGNKEKVDVYIGKSLPEKINKLIEADNEKSNAGIVLTASNPESKLLRLDENSKRNNELKEKLLGLDYIFYPAVGQGLGLSWPEEESFFIINLTQAQAQEIAVEFGQFAYVWLEFNKPAELIFTPLWYKQDLIRG